jgi:hypothetical protein
LPGARSGRWPAAEAGVVTVPLEHSPDRRPLSQVFGHGRQGGHAAGLAYLFDCEPGERISARLAARSGQQFGVLDEAERIPCGSNRTPGELALCRCKPDPRGAGRDDGNFPLQLAHAHYFR